MSDSEKAIWTPLKIVQWAVPFLTQKGLPQARLDAETLVAHALGIDRLKVYLQFDRPLDAQELAVIRDYMKRRSNHEPIQYIVGKREFYGHTFKVAPGVLIPRPETEQLVELAVEYLKTLSEEQRTVLDLGTGSGCIALSVAKALPCQVWAVDLSGEALVIAQENAHFLGIQGVEWRQGDWFSSLKPEDPQVFQVILSNPPYIPLKEKAEMELQVRDFEPEMALFGGESGLEAYEKLAISFGDRLKPNGIGLLELHAEGLSGVLPLFERQGFKGESYTDLQGFARVLKLQK